MFRMCQSVCLLADLWSTCGRIFVKFREVMELGNDSSWLDFEVLVRWSLRNLSVTTLRSSRLQSWNRYISFILFFTSFILKPFTVFAFTVLSCNVFHMETIAWEKKNFTMYFASTFNQLQSMSPSPFSSWSPENKKLRTGRGRRRRRRRALHRQWGPLHGSSSYLRCFEPTRVKWQLNPIKPAYVQHRPVGWLN